MKWDSARSERALESVRVEACCSETKQNKTKQNKYRDVCVGVGDGKSRGVHNVAGHWHGAGDGRAEASAVGAQHGEVLRHIWRVARVDADAGEFADVELEGVAVQGSVV